MNTSMQKILLLVAMVAVIGGGMAFGIHSAQATERRVTWGAIKSACLPDAGCDTGKIAPFPDPIVNANTNTNNNTNSGANKNQG